jgi:hypothetical protein
LYNIRILWSEQMSAIPRTGLALVGILVVVATALPVVSAQSTVSRTTATDCLAGTWVDSYGNHYRFTGSSAGCPTSYKIKGKVTSSPYLSDIPWKITGSGTGTSFTFTAHAPKGVPSNECSYVVTASFPPGNSTASGTVRDVCAVGTLNITLTPT